MATLNFPSNPTIGDIYEFEPYRYTWDGEKWKTIGIGYNPAAKLSPTVRSNIQRLAAEAGYNLVSGSFEDGGSLTTTVDVLWSQLGGKYYSWSGSFPKVVSAGSTPTTSGGIGVGAWVDRTEDRLRSDLNVVVKTFNSVADMVADTSLVAGQTVATLGYHYGSSLGGNKYKIVPAGTGTADGGEYIALSNSYQAKAIFSEKISCDQFGANLDAYIGYCLRNNKTIYFSDCNYTTASSYDLKNSGSGAKILGKTRDRSVLNYTGAASFLNSISDATTTIYNVGLENIKLLGNAVGTAFTAYNTVYGVYDKVWIQNFTNGMVASKSFGNKYSNFEVWNCTGTGISFQSDNNNAVTLSDSNINNCGTGISLTGCSQVGITKSILEKCTNGLLLSGLNYKITVDNIYAENNNIAFVVNGGSDLTVVNSIAHCESNQSVFSVVNSNTKSILELTVKNCYIRDNKENSTFSFMDLTNSSGTDIVRISILDNTFKTSYSGSALTMFTSGGAPIVPDPKIIKQSDVAIYSTSSPTADAGTMTINSPLSFFPMKDGLMRLLGKVTVYTTITLTGINQCRFLLPDVRFAGKYNQDFPIYSISADPATSVAAVLTIRSDGKITIASSAAIAGLTFNIDEIYSRLYYPA